MKMKMFSSSAPKVHANMTCGLKVDTQSPGWEKTLHKVLKKFDGLKYLIDVEEGTAIVTGRADPNKILKKLAKAGKHAEICCAGTDFDELKRFSMNKGSSSSCLVKKRIK